MLRPLFDQKSRRDGRIDDNLRRALHWWLHVLRIGLAEVRVWGMPEQCPVNLFCDARGQPPHLAAILFCDGQRTFTHMKPPAAVLEQFKRRKDNQIMGLELLAISLGLSTFQEQLSGRKVVIHSDNSGSEVSPPPPPPHSC